jgi:hypothetical protein
LKAFALCPEVKIFFAIVYLKMLIFNFRFLIKTCHLNNL